MQEYPIEYLSAAPWTFLSNEIIQILEKKMDKCQPLDSLADIFVGLQTSADPIYIIKSEAEENGFVKFFDNDKRIFYIFILSFFTKISRITQKTRFYLINLFLTFGMVFVITIYS